MSLVRSTVNGGSDMSEREMKQQIKATFNSVAKVYDSRPLRFFRRAANLLPEVFGFGGDESVLDIAAGTGISALAMAAHLPRGSVMAVDFSESMLAEGVAKCKNAGFENITFRLTDMTNMDFVDARFDAANCSFGLFFVEDMVGTLQHVASKVRPGGAVVTTHFRAGSFNPLADMLYRRVQAYGLPLSPPRWLQRVGTEEQNEAIFKHAGLSSVEMTRHDVGYFLDDATQWWDVIWNAGYRSLISTLDEEQLARFKREHLDEVSRLMTPEGLRLHVEVLITKGYRS